MVSLPAARAPDLRLFPPDRAQQLAQANHALAAKYFLEAAELDDGEDRDLEAAAAGYRRAVLFDPHDLYRDYDVPRVRNLNELAAIVTDL